MLGVGDVAICVTCHVSESVGYQVAKALKESLEDLKAAMRKAERVLGVAERAGMEVGEVRYNFQGVHQMLIQARNVVHASSLEVLEEVIAKGESMAAAAIQAGKDALAELQARRRMMSIPLTAIGLVMVLLYAKIRDLERP
jgi:predicted nucleic acid-binding protein